MDPNRAVENNKHTHTDTRGGTVQIFNGKYFGLTSIINIARDGSSLFVCVTPKDVVTQIKHIPEGGRERERERDRDRDRDRQRDRERSK